MADSENTALSGSEPGPPTPTLQPPVPPADDGLKRTTTTAILVRLVKFGWQFFGAGVAYVVFSGTDQKLMAVIMSALAFVVVVGGFFSWLSWSRFRYGVVDNHLVIHEGVIVRRLRSIPVARVQGIDIKADLIMRALGLVQVTVQTAGGGATEPEATIVGIPLSEAESLRSALLHGRAAAAIPGIPGTTAAIGGDPVNRMSDVRGLLAGGEVDFERPSFQYQLPVGRLVLAGATSSQVFISFFVVLGVAGQLFSAAGDRFTGIAANFSALAIPAAVFTALLVVVFVLIGSVTAVVIADFGFTSRRVDDRIETERGLIERRMVGLPVRRVQSVSVKSTPLRRLMGFSAIHVDTAGFGRSEENGRATSALIPLARSAEIRPLLHGLIPEFELAPVPVALPGRSLRRYLFLPVAAVLVLMVPVAAFLGGYWWVLPFIAVAIVASPAALAWKGAGLGVSDSMLVIRSGMLGRNQTRIPRSRLQSLAVRQTPFQKRAKLATLVARTVSGSSGATYRVRHLDAAVAWRLVEWLSRTRAEPVTSTVTAPSEAVSEHA